MTPVRNSWLRRALGFVRAALGLKQVVQGASLIVVGLLVIFGGKPAHYAVGALMMLYGWYLICGGRL